MLPCVVITPIAQSVLDFALWRIFLLFRNHPAICDRVPEGQRGVTVGCLVARLPR